MKMMHHSQWLLSPSFSTQLEEQPVKAEIETAVKAIALCPSIWDVYTYTNSCRSIHGFLPRMISKTSIQKDKKWNNQIKLQLLEGSDYTKKEVMKDNLTSHIIQNTQQHAFPWYQGFASQEAPTSKKAERMSWADMMEEDVWKLSFAINLKDWIWEISAQSQSNLGVISFDQKMVWNSTGSFKCFKIKLNLSPLFFAGKNRSNSSFISMPWLRAALIGRRLRSVWRTVNGSIVSSIDIWCSQKGSPVPKVVIALLWY